MSHIETAKKLRPLAGMIQQALASGASNAFHQFIQQSNTHDLISLLSTISTDMQQALGIGRLPSGVLLYSATAQAFFDALDSLSRGEIEAIVELLDKNPAFQQAISENIQKLELLFDKFTEFLMNPSDKNMDNEYLYYRKNGHLITEPSLDQSIRIVPKCEASILPHKVYDDVNFSNGGQTEEELSLSQSVIFSPRVAAYTPKKDVFDEEWVLVEDQAVDKSQENTQYTAQVESSYMCMIKSYLGY